MRSNYTTMGSIAEGGSHCRAFATWTEPPVQSVVRVSPKSTQAGGRRGGHDHPQGLSDTWSEVV